MYRWIMLGLTLLGFALAFTTKSPGLLGLGLLFGLVGLFGFVLALANDRIAANARPDTAMASVEELVALRKSRAATPTPPAPAAAKREDEPPR